MADRQWHYAIDNTQHGPVSEAQLKQLLQDGTLGPATYVWTDGMDGWDTASAVPDLLPSVPAPAVEAQPYPSRPVRTTPVAVTVFGVLNIVFGGMSLFAMPFALMVTFTRTDVHRGGAYFAWTVFSFLVGLVYIILMITLGIGLLKLRSWARKGTLAYGYFAIVWSIVGMIVNVSLVMSGARGGRADPAVQMVGFVLGGLISLIYPICLIVFMRRPNVVNACTK
ncbi:MAG: DUF4339 domain-containing protein [Phycisphaerales bacterium]|nr:MAG: DUF4339 domain-containing protein [Phycisphaerales bacterium]